MGLGKSDMIRTCDSCSALINSIKGSIGEKKKEEKTKNSTICMYYSTPGPTLLIASFSVQANVVWFFKSSKGRVHIQFYVL
jgi:hypothetical protein